MSPRLRGRQELLAFTRRLGQLGVDARRARSLAGTIGFVLTTDYGPFDAFVLSLDTIATIGSIPAPETIARSGSCKVAARSSSASVRSSTRLVTVDRVLRRRTRSTRSLLERAQAGSG